MSKPSEPHSQPTHVPTRRERLRPLELLIFSAVLAIFAGLIVLLTTRSLLLAVIFFGVAFIASVLVVALLGLGGEPSDEDKEAAKDLQPPVVGAAGRRAREAAESAETENSDTLDVPSPDGDDGDDDREDSEGRRA